MHTHTTKKDLAHIYMLRMDLLVHYDYKTN